MLKRILDLFKPKQSAPVCKIYGYLHPREPLCKVFPGGRIPLTSTIPTAAPPLKWYVLDYGRLDLNQIDAMVDYLSETWLSLPTNQSLSRSAALLSLRSGYRIPDIWLDRVVDLGV